MEIKNVLILTTKHIISKIRLNIFSIFRLFIRLNFGHRKEF